MPFFTRKGWDLVTPEAFLGSVGFYLRPASEFQLSVLAGEDHHATALAGKNTSGGLDGWDWNEHKALPLSWYVGFADSSVG